MKAILEVEFDKDMMIDQESLDKEFNGDWLKFMQWMFKEESIGMFEEEIKLIEVRD